ncbi:hypothetical protein SY83_08380 [Paenibacillus swuensis]|uniref:HTH cro/C1-type domain-containing protein n=1 Tax=Paenibacillus swuensis TaxID=1178515 RepID=A0A172TGV3_9BACL|nr:hypothetical protein [Paenibacillus swuensis]ANE46288.1 hypothetical protein SY83_08380 [Paenibacillus swuensis]
MEINKIRVRKLLDEEAAGNYRELARILDVQVSQLHKLINKDSKAGPVFLGKLRQYCIQKGIPFDDFIK